MPKTQTKTEVRNAAAKINKLLRGIDNSAQVILRDKKKLEEKISGLQKDAQSVKTLVSSVSDTALAAMDASAAKPPAAKQQGASPAKAAPKAAPKPAAKKPAAPAKKPAVKKPAAPAKKPAAKKPAAPAPAKPAAPAKAKDGKASVTPTVRPPLKEVISDILVKGPAGAAEIYKAAVEKHGYWSRQSLYNALKDVVHFVKDGDRYSLVPSEEKKDEAEAFVERVEKDAATAHVS